MEETGGFKDRDAKAIRLMINLREESEMKQLNGNSWFLQHGVGFVQTTKEQATRALSS